MVPLQVLNTPVGGSVSPVDPSRLAAELDQLAPGCVRFGQHERMLYATDASIYQIEPIGVVVPDSIDTLIRIVTHCAGRGVPLLMRGGGTSLPGQCTNHAVVIDHSASCKRLLSIDLDNRLCLVEPGIVVDDLNRQLEARDAGLFFAPDPATAAQATVGGCIGNNAAGARSLRYGRTSENIAGLEVLLASGQRCWLEPSAGRRSPVALRLAEQVADVVQRYASQIRQRFPKTSRRNAGYALDVILAQLDHDIAPADLDLTGLICGSAGTLAVVLGAKLKLHPIPRFKGLAIASFPSVEAAIHAVPSILHTQPAAVELIDDVVLDAARANAECRRYMDLLPLVNGSNPAAVLYVEYQETGSADDLTAKFDALRQLLPDAPIAPYTDRKSLSRAWALRKAGEPLLHNLSAHRKPITCVEDNAIPIENLARFVDGFKQIVTRHGTKAAYYAHASVGVLHVRPMLDLHDPADRDRLRAIAIDVADLARECGGIMSGEHGDGRIRGPLLERYFGPDLMAAFRQIKAIFDPQNLLNPGITVDLGPVETITQNLRVAPRNQPLAWPNVETYFDYSDQEGFVGAVEMCNGAGVCRRSAGGVMCPSYRATLDERHSTRGRANALRLAISGQFSSNNQPAWADPDTLQTLSLCLSCKACKSECPSNVDVARLKAEFTAQRYKATGQVPLQARVFGHIRALNQLGSLAPHLANWAANLPLIRQLMNRILDLAPQRTLPPFAHSLYRWFARRPASDSQAARPKVVLFADCFTTYNEPHIGQAAILLLESLGYTVQLPKVGCCGRSMISMGLLEDAIRTADATLAQLRPYIVDDQVKAILVCEPSCLATMKDEWLTLKLKTDKALRLQLASKAMMVEDFVERFWSQHPLAPEPRDLPTNDVVFHGHCHQKALGDDSSTAILKRLTGDRLTVLPSGCCGMAGAFGYTRQRYELSMKVGDQSLFTHLRAAAPDALIVAPGTSCRHQIKDGTHRLAQHPVELLHRLLTNPRP
ncbi:MAG TPA: FAD-linked oxidase C-terminal domain-containing protein [Tepidisphaeraceae bacterium]|nr:FAD-linked oxidase C-terminal domain-containing protein [Tepidisphaeraceae bacterium]